MSAKSMEVNIDLPGYVVEKKFTSRKNSVFLVKNMLASAEPQYLVYKKYAYPERMPGEVAMLRVLQAEGIAVPQVYEENKDYILLEYLEGPLLLDCYTRQEGISGSYSDYLDEPTHRLIHLLCRWFKDFYKVVHSIRDQQLLMGDVNFRNFIMVKGKIYGIDLEEWREGRIEKEIGSLCAFALTYDPTFTRWKLAMVRELLKVFIGDLNLDKKMLQKAVEQELVFLGQIRGTAEEYDSFLAGDLFAKIFRV
jgi:hypothetical protein